MSAFDPAAFDSAAFDTGTSLTPIDTGVAVCPLSISVVSVGPATPLPLAVSVVSPLVFASPLYAVRWSLTARIGDVDYSARLTGAINISAGEDAARVASFSLIPSSPSDIVWLDGKTVTLDVTLFETAASATYRLFTGVIEGRVFAPASRVIDVSCSDGWQERPKACTSPASVEALFGGLATPCRKLVKWSDTEPDPSSYFSSLLATMTGATAIDSNGLWRAIPWAIGTPSTTFGAGEVFGNSLTVGEPNRADVPSAISARLNFRYNRLRAAEVILAWSAVDYHRFVIDGLPTLAKSTVLQALSGASGWLIKGTPTFVEPVPGGYQVNLPNGTPVAYLVGAPEAALTAESFTAVLYHRWYQEIDVAYSIDIDMGGSSDRDDSISVSLASEFAGSNWETAPTTESTTGLYAANAPAQPVTPTGYEGLPLPHPPANSSLEWYPDITAAELSEAGRHVVALALRKAALGRRKRTVEFARPLDPRWEIGSVLAVNAHGVAATGQVTELQHDLDLDSGEIVSTFRLACPLGSGSVTGFSAVIVPPTAGVGYSVTSPTLSNHIGASTETLANPPPDSLAGYLCNVFPDSPDYDATAPVYQTQFRLVLPEISATVRDPLTVEAPIDAAVTIAGGTLAITF